MTFGTLQLFKIYRFKNYCNSCTVSNFTILSTILSWSHAADTISFIGSRKGELVCCDFQNGSIWPLDDLLTWCSWTSWQLLINIHAFTVRGKMPCTETMTYYWIFTDNIHQQMWLHKISVKIHVKHCTLQGDRISCKL